MREALRSFFKAQTTGGYLLIFSAVVAIIWSNSPFRESYHHLWETPFVIQIGGLRLDNTLHHWINDGLMSLFFFMVGLELKREFIAGELKSIRNALLPLAAAVGGMVFPALIFLFFNASAPDRNGWGIPMATDIAFALGILAMVKHIPFSLKIFLTTLAIADDIGAVLVIAFFYSSNISLISLGVGSFFILLLAGANMLGIRSTFFYSIIGISGVWVAFALSGIHATIAGVLLAITIPARTKIDELIFVEKLESNVKRFKEIPPNDVRLLEPAQAEVLDRIYLLTKAAGTPLQRLEHALHPWITFLVLPLFALANSGIELSSSMFDFSPLKNISIGIFLGLFLGKALGILLICYMMKGLKWASWPEDVNAWHMWGMAFLAGIGFTMSLFISELAYSPLEDLINEAKLGIFAGSILSGVVGYFLLKTAYSKTLGTRK